MWRVTSRAGRDLIEQFEGRRNRAYRDLRGIWTCGIGSTGGHVGPETIWTDAEVDEHFKADLRRFEVAINKLVTVPLNQNQFDALVSLSFNIGINALKNSTLLRKLNATDYHGCLSEFPRWAHVKGTLTPGLLRRRRAEAELFVTRP